MARAQAEPRKPSLDEAGWALAMRSLTRPDLPARPEWPAANVPPPAIKRPPVPKKNTR
jgi:hypothetical protein